jgi:hypothetical protein
MDMGISAERERFWSLDTWMEYTERRFKYSSWGVGNSKDEMKGFFGIG